MNTLLDFGRVFLAIPIAAFGIQYFIYGHLEGGLPVVPPGCLPHAAAMFFLWVLVLHAPLVATHLNNGNQWSSLFVAMGMGGASLILAASTQNQRPPHRLDPK